MMTIMMIIGCSNVVFAGGVFEATPYIDSVSQNSITIRFSISESSGTKLDDYSFIKYSFDKPIYGFGFFSFTDEIEREPVSQLPAQPISLDVYVPNGTTVSVECSDNIKLQSGILQEFGEDFEFHDKPYNGESFVPSEYGSTRFNYTVSINDGYAADIERMISFVPRTATIWQYDLENQDTMNPVYTLDQMIDAIGKDTSIENSTPTNQLQTTSDITAVPTASKTTINGQEVSFQTYTIEDYTYLKLRDIAMAVNGTEKNFSINWDNEKKAISITTKQPYQSVGGELAQSNQVNQPATESAATLYVDGVKKDLPSYTIDGNTYFQLRDIGQLIDFYVGWDQGTKTIQIDTTNRYAA